MSQNKKTESAWETGLKWAVAAAVVGTAGYVAYKAGEMNANRSHALEETSCSSGRPCDDPEKCVVCWDSITPLRRLNCGHVFHHNCISSWLYEKSTCPLCRQKQ
ncbi:hypothetical protein ILUMI_11205 [Ignelater luminosus]|uniref:RING-type domain-containing protein n=1 Tax=Ignelater luminosus TaxID=2038154 RepID=A0A8K0GAR0_IGNLU|nr:hypothetical protein ILUMI_11205 [Ignelater luminosus]